MEPPTGVLPDWQVVCEVSARMGYAMQYSHPRRSWMIAQLAPLFAGSRTIGWTCREGLQWPVPSTAHPGTSLMHEQSFPKGEHGLFRWSISARRGAQRILSAGADHRPHLCSITIVARRPGAPTSCRSSIPMCWRCMPATRLGWQLRDGELVRPISARGGGTAAHCGERPCAAGRTVHEVFIFPTRM